MAADRNRNKAIVKTFVLELSIAIHSVIIGIAFGGMSNSKDITTIKVLLAALTFYQFFEGISLGAAIIESNLKFPTVLFFALVFSFSFATGGIIGITKETDDSSIQGCFNAFAAGSLIYSALVEMMAEEFSSSELNHRP